jgi:hypothetical protein
VKTIVSQSITRRLLESRLSISTPCTVRRQMMRVMRVRVATPPPITAPVHNRDIGEGDRRMTGHRPPLRDQHQGSDHRRRARRPVRSVTARRPASTAGACLGPRAISRRDTSPQRPPRLRHSRPARLRGRPRLRPPTDTGSRKRRRANNDPRDGPRVATGFCCSAATLSGRKSWLPLMTS